MKRILNALGCKSKDGVVDDGWLVDEQKVMETSVEDINSWFLGLSNLNKRQIFSDYAGPQKTSSTSGLDERALEGSRPRRESVRREETGMDQTLAWSGSTKSLLQQQVRAASVVSEDLLSEMEDEDEDKVVMNGDITSGIIPAGSSFPRLEASENTWEPCPGTYFRIRQPGYASHGQKDFSGPSFYELLGVDTFRTTSHRESKLVPRKIARHPHVVSSNHPHVPSVFVVNCQIPYDTPIMFNKSTNYDGACTQIVFHFGITEECRDWLADYEQSRTEGKEAEDDSQIPPALKLLVEWCKRAEEDFDYRARFKAMAMIDNMDDLELPSLVQRYNGKPALITYSGTLSRGDDFLEMDINVHKFAYIARKGLDYVKDKLERGLIRVGFTIEAREEEHLPEQMLGCAFVKRYKRDKAKMFDDL
eukprot:CAMPEP_0117750820 /NCGR_PEP_ID=MMETSP0947-20121206/10607_1 /TAXON_ID=44440 /ORGANISM="Chattonella subsalsa, Strain CCMP2191" /LENGTH=418 /DNA_ID=CAMNT_0005569083 /DNA_START=147 /DNA_END=1406 /DNA_ORIENTATION=-